jgi:hypothetical protein
MLASCKKDNSSSATGPATIEFDIDGVHHTFNLPILNRNETDTGLLQGKSLDMVTDSWILPQVWFKVIDKSYAYKDKCFLTGNYPAVAGNPFCQDTIPAHLCLGFFMQYADTGGVGLFGTFSLNDSLSSLNVTSCTAKDSIHVLNGIFSCTLIDSTGRHNPKQVSNGKLTNIQFR